MKFSVRCIFILIALVHCEICRSEFSDFYELSDSLDVIIAKDHGIVKKPRQVDPELWIWKDYEHGTGFGNREELSIKHIEVLQDPNVPKHIDNWQYLEHEDDIYLSGTTDSTFSLYHFNAEYNSASLVTTISSLGTIESFKIISAKSNTDAPWRKRDIYVVLAININNYHYLYWYQMIDSIFANIWIWNLKKPVKNLLYFNANDGHKLMLLYANDVYFDRTLSAIEIFDIKLNGYYSQNHLCQQSFVPETTHAQVCISQYDETIITLINKNSVMLYEYRDEDLVTCTLKKISNILIEGDINSICFRSGYMNYLATTGYTSHLYNNYDNNFLLDEKMENLLFEIKNAKSVQSFLVHNYREEVVLFFQSVNSSVSAFNWQGSNGFHSTSLPNEILNNYDLSKAIAIPNYGFLIGNTYIKFGFELKQLSQYEESDIQTALEIKSVFEDILDKQQLIDLKNQLVYEQNIIDNIESNKFSVSTEIIVDNLIINKTDGIFFKVGSDDIGFEELQSIYENVNRLISELEIKTNKIEQIIQENAKYLKSTIDKSLDSIDITGELTIKDTLEVENLTINHLNDMPISSLMDECVKKENKKITGLKSFPTINFTEDSLKIMRLNGQLLSDIKFQNDNKNYTGLDLANVSTLKVAGNLHFTKINNTNWQELMHNVVFKNEEKTIPGITIISGKVTARYILMNSLNGLKYPSDFVIKSSPVEAEVTGIKTFSSIIVSELENIRYINDISIDEFIFLHQDQNLTNQITFENLIIEENLQINGEIIGLPDGNIDPNLNLLNSHIVQCNTKFSNLYVTGKVYVENLINGRSWSELDDLILNDEENVIVTGTKVFLDSVYIGKELEIKTGMINGYHVSDFITLDTQQVLPNLSLVFGNVIFEKVSYEELIDFERKVNSSLDESGSPICMKKVVIFSAPPLIDTFSPSYINENIRNVDFSEKLDVFLKNVQFDHLKVKNLIVEDLEAKFVNGINYQAFKNERISKNGYQSIKGKINIKYLELNELYADYVNGRTKEEIESRINVIKSLYDSVFNGNTIVESLSVNGIVTTRTINDKDLYDNFDLGRIDKFILKINMTIEDVLVDDLVNGINFTEKVHDCILKTNNTVIVKGRMKMQKLKAENLQVNFVNGRSVDDMISPFKNQRLTGPIKVKGSVRVLKSFNSTSTINNVSYNNIDGVISKLNDEVYKLTGNFIVQSHTNVKNLNIIGSTQDKNIEEFLNNLIYLDEKVVVVRGRKIFDNSIDFGNNVTVMKNFHEIDLETFYNNVVLIDRPISMKSSIVFINDIFIEKDMRISSVRANAINNVNLNKLMENANYLKRPPSIIENLTLSNVEFKTNIFVEFWNDIMLDSVITLYTDQIIPGTLLCTDATVENMEINGFVNNEKLEEMYSNTFMLSKDQHIIGKIVFVNNVYVNGDFSSQYINDVDVTKAVSLNDDDDSMTGDIVFNDPVVIYGNLIVHGKVNNVDIQKWQSMANKNRSSSKQIIYGNLTVHGNVHFQQDVYVSGFLNGIDLQKFDDDISQEKKTAEAYVLYERRDLKKKCEKLNDLKDAVNSAVYKFKSFEYLQVLEFDQKIVSVHHFELNGIDYVMVNFESCNLDVYAYTSKGFVKASEIFDFGIVKQYITLSYKDELYFITLGKPECGRNSGNIWVLKHHQFEHIFDLKNVIDMQKLGNDAFAVVINRQVEKWTIEDIHMKRFEPVRVIAVKNSKVQFFSIGNNTYLASRESIYDLNVSGRSDILDFEEYKNLFGTKDILSFRAGIYQKEFLLYYDEKISNDYIFICNNYLEQRKILQTIFTKKPNSFTILDFEGLYETLFIFTENKRKIQIYEYKGIEGFKYRSNIKMKSDMLFNFKLRIQPHFVKKHCLAVIQENRLSILQAKMYGDKLETNNRLACHTT